MQDKTLNRESREPPDKYTEKRRQRMGTFTERAIEHRRAQGRPESEEGVEYEAEHHPYPQECKTGRKRGERQDRDARNHELVFQRLQA